LRRHQDEIEKLGARIVAIGTGNPDFAAAFVRDEQIEFPVLIDQDAEAAKAIELASLSVIGLLKPSLFAARNRAREAGHKQKKTGARPLQLGATLVVAPGGEVIYEYRDRDTGDHAPMEEVVAALRGEPEGAS
jgi:peroxiredoxin